MYTKDLSGNVPLYGQEQGNFCGPACGQMTRNGYPNTADRLFYTQPDLWNTIQIYNNSNAVDVAQQWASDPHGLKGCLQNLANPPGVQWMEFSDAKRDQVLFDILLWMNNREYPSPVLINAGWHWVVIIGWTTDVEPAPGSNPILQSIEVHDSEPQNKGSDTRFTAAQWYAGPWNFPVCIPGTWLNKYVAVVAPPLARGRVHVKRVKRIGPKLLTPEQALNYARGSIEEQQLRGDPKYALLRRDDAVAATPLLIREEAAGSRARNVPQYYIVGFGLRGETDDRGEPLIRIAILVNAYSGTMEEVTAFGRPIRYLKEEEAKAVVARAMHLEPEELSDAEAGLMFQFGGISHIRSYPFWRVQVRKKKVYVDQLGQVYAKLPPGTPGD